MIMFLGKLNAKKLAVLPQKVIKEIVNIGADSFKTYLPNVLLLNCTFYMHMHTI